MERKNLKNLTWFGFNITQKQAVQVFVLSLIGILISIFILSSFVYTIVLSMIYYNPIYDPGHLYILRTFLSMSPYIIMVLIIFVLSSYSALRCRRIAKYYSKFMFNVSKSANTPQYCPNCGQLRIKGAKFCKNCGAEF
ncbi:MAG: zinc ribbon domain-containing protein [Candidatus Lokiarchaeota archaeon]